MSEIHPTAIVDNPENIGQGCYVGPFSCIGPNVKVGNNCKIESHVVLDGHTTIGERNHIFQFASIGAAPQDKKWKGEPTKLFVGNDNIIREYVTMQPGIEEFGGETRIGDRNLIMACAHIAHDVRLGDDNWLTNCAALGGHVEIGSRVILGGLTGVHQFCRIGDLSFIAVGSIVTQDVPPFCIAQGDRARLRSVNRVGMSRAAFSTNEIADVVKIFKETFVLSKSREEGLTRLQQMVPTSNHAQKLASFMNGESKRGIMGYRKSSESR